MFTMRESGISIMLAALWLSGSASLPAQTLATLPAGATTGEVKVVTPSGTLSSNVPFRVP